MVQEVSEKFQEKSGGRNGGAGSTPAITGNFIAWYGFARGMSARFT